MDLGDFETTIKVIVVGNGGVGKSSMAARYCQGVFTENYKKTIGVDFLEKTIELPDTGESVKLMIWDTAGQEEFDALTSSYYRGAGAGALVFSTIDRASFEAIPKWKKKIHDEVGNDISLVLVQNKIDLVEKSVVTPEEVENLARKLKLRLFRTCVKDNTNVGEVFEFLSSQYILGGGEPVSGSAVSAVGEFNGSSGFPSVHSQSSPQTFSTEKIAPNTTIVVNTSSYGKTTTEYVHDDEAAAAPEPAPVQKPKRPQVIADNTIRLSHNMHRPEKKKKKGLLSQC